MLIRSSQTSTGKIGHAVSAKGDSPSDGSIAEIAAVDEREAVDDAAGDDQSSINAMDDLSLLLVRIDWIIVEGQVGGIRSRLFIEGMPTVGTRIANFLVGLRMHSGRGCPDVPHSRNWGRLVYIRTSQLGVWRILVDFSASGGATTFRPPNKPQIRVGLSVGLQADAWGRSSQIGS